MRRKSSFLPCPVPDMVPGDFQAPLRCARNDRKQESLSPHGLRRRKALLDLPLCHIVMLSNLLNQPLRGYPLPPLTRSPSPMDGGGKDVAGNAFCSCAMLSILLNQPPMAAFPPFGALRHHLRSGRKRVTRFSGRYHSPTNRVPLPTRKSGGTIKLR